jgi:hypothetical protein
MKSFLLSALFFNFCLANAQNSISSRYAVDRLSDAGGLSTNETVYGIPQKPGEIIGDYYYHSELRTGSVILENGQVVISKIEFRYHIKSNQLEINYPTGLRVLDGNKVQAFRWINPIGSDQVFVNANEFTINGVGLSCFFEVISDGSSPLLKRRTFEYLPANYVPALNAGSRDDKIIKKDEYYFAKGLILYNVPHSKKKLLENFSGSKVLITEYIQQNKLSLKNQNDLKNLFDYINLSNLK